MPPLYVESVTHALWFQSSGYHNLRHMISSQGFFYLVQYFLRLLHNSAMSCGRGEEKVNS
jgi:hypothetical protein